jgi:surface antigen
MQHMGGSMTTLSRAWRGILVSTILMAFLLMGCESAGPKTAIGGLGGAAAGGLLAAALGGEGTGIAAGTILGGLLGGAIGDRLDAADRQRANAAAAQALESIPSGQSVAWRNPDSGNTGAVTPVRTYQTATGSIAGNIRRPSTSAVKGISPTVSPAANPMGPGELSAKRHIWSPP